MPMKVQQSQYGPMVGWTKGDDDPAGGEFFALTPIMSTTDHKSLRVTLELLQTMGNVTAVAGITTSNDGSTWGTPMIIEDAMTDPLVSRDTPGFAYSQEWADLASYINNKLYMRLGFILYNTDEMTNTDKLMAYVAMQFEFRKW